MTINFTGMVQFVSVSKHAKEWSVTRDEAQLKTLGSKSLFFSPHLLKSFTDFVADRNLSFYKSVDNYTFTIPADTWSKCFKSLQCDPSLAFQFAFQGDYYIIFIMPWSTPATNVLCQHALGNQPACIRPLRQQPAEIWHCTLPECLLQGQKHVLVGKIKKILLKKSNTSSADNLQVRTG